MELTVEDKILITRALLGGVHGVVTAVVSMLFDLEFANRLSWSLAPVVYYFSIIYVDAKYKPNSRYLTYLKGLLTFLASWIAIAVMIYELGRP